MTKKREVLKVYYDVQDWWSATAESNGMWVGRGPLSGFSRISEARKEARERRKRFGEGVRTRIIKTTREVVEMSK